MPYTRLATTASGDAIGRIKLLLTHVTSPTNSTIVPAVGADVRAYRRGATVTQEIELFEGSTEVVSVEDSGEITVGDMLFVESAIDNNVDWLSVYAVGPDRLTITVQYSGYRMLLLPGMRMTPTGTVPQMYADRIGGSAVALATTDSQGQTEFSLATAGTARPELGFDFTVHYQSATGWAPQLYTLAPRAAADYVDTRDFASLQAAIDACPPGGRLYIPTGTYHAPPGGFVVDKSIEIFGDGGQATTLKPNVSAKANEPVLKFVASAPVISAIYLHDFGVRADGVGVPTQRYPGSHGISFIVPDSSHQFITIRIERVLAAALGDDGFHIEGHDIGSGAIVFVYGVALEAIECWGSGFFVRFATVVEMHNCYANGNRLFGGYARESQIAWYMCAFENNCRRLTPTDVQPGGPDSLMYNEEWGAQLRMNTCHPARVDACDFESFGVTTAEPDRTVKSAIILEGCNGSLVSNCNFYNPTRQVGSTISMDSTCKGVVIPSGDGSVQFPSEGWATVMPCVFSNVGKPVVVGDYASAVSVFPQRLLKDPTAQGTIDFKPPGLALPVIGTATELRQWQSFAAGHLLFDASSGVNKLKCWDGTAWRTVAWEP